MASGVAFIFFIYMLHMHLIMTYTPSNLSKVTCRRFVYTAMCVYLGKSLGGHMQVIADAAAIDAKAAAGMSITPLCGLPLVRCTFVWQLCAEACL